MLYLVLTPGLEGRDGISCLTRQIVRALGDGAPLGVEIWSLEPLGSSLGASGGARFRPSGGSRLRLVLWSLACIFRNCRETTVVVMHANLSPLALPLRLRGARVVQVLHGIEVWKRLSPLRRRVFRMSDRLVSVSRHSAERFERANPGVGRPAICHPGLPGGLPAIDGGKDSSPFALIVGRMSSEERYKGHDILLEVWPEVLGQIGTASLTVVGGGDDSARLAEKAKELGLADSVRFAGVVSDEELDRLYRDCAFFVMPSRNEGFGLVFLEAMRAGKACIGGEGAPSEVIQHEKTGFVVNPGDRAQLREVLLRLFRSPELRRRLGDEGRKRFEEEFTDRAFQSRWSAVLDGMGG
jgi:phosphatidyl-myo-inositol dimannoside synthase